MAARGSKAPKARAEHGTPGRAPRGSVSDAERFAKLFAGYTRAYGVFRVTKLDDKGKAQGKAATLRETVTTAHYQQHLDGSQGLGIIMLTEEDTCWFGAIDYDNRDVDHAELEQKVKALHLPLVICRSKSGGAHLYVFAETPVPASTLRDRLEEWVALLGMSSKTEQFPKQSTRFNENDLGSWINLPYFQAADTARYAVHEGKPVPLGTFLDLAEAARLPEAAWHTPSLADVSNDPDDLFHEGPPCLQLLHQAGGFPEGGRNLGMTAVMTYLKKRFPDAWEAKADAYNQAMAKIGSQELQQIIKNFRRKDYGYQCKQPPINSCCQRRLCLKRLHGVGPGAPESTGHQITSLTRYDYAEGDEPMWGLEINGQRLLVTNSQLYNRDDFNRAAMAQANLLPIHMNMSRWLQYLSTLIVSADVVPMPADAGPVGQLWEWIKTYLTQGIFALERDEVVLGKPYRKDGWAYFRGQDLFRFLDARRVRYKSEQFVWQVLRQHDAEKHEWRLRGVLVNVWALRIPDLPVSDEAPTQLLADTMEDF